MHRSRIEFYVDGDPLPEVVLIEDYISSGTTVGDRVAVLNDNMKGVPKGNPALVALEYVLAYQRTNICQIWPTRADETRPDAWVVRCYNTHLEWEQYRQGRRVA